MKNVLVVAAHPDDEVLGCGGTIAKYSKDNNIYLVILGEGISSRYIQRNEGKKKELLQLRKDSQKVGELLGIKEIFFFALPDNRFDTVSFLDIVKKVEEIIKKIKPEIIYTHYSGDLNIDHRLTFQAVLTATRPVKGCSVKEIYSFEIPSSTEWSFGKIEKDKIFNPNIFEDISDALETKLKALKAYKNEIRKFPHPRSSKTIRAMATRWGSVAGLKYAEAFELTRKIID